MLSDRDPSLRTRALLAVATVAASAGGLVVGDTAPAAAAMNDAVASVNCEGGYNIDVAVGPFGDGSGYTEDATNQARVGHQPGFTFELGTDPALEDVAVTVTQLDGGGSEIGSQQVVLDCEDGTTTTTTTTTEVPPTTVEEPTTTTTSTTSTAPYVPTEPQLPPVDIVEPVTPSVPVAPPAVPVRPQPVPQNGDGFQFGHTA